MHRHQISLSDEQLNGLVRVREYTSFTSQKIAELLTAANLRLTKGAAVANEVRRDQLIQLWPRLSIHGLDERSDNFLIEFTRHTREGWTLRPGGRSDRLRKRRGYKM